MSKPCCPCYVSSIKKYLEMKINTRKLSIQECNCFNNNQIIKNITAFIFFLLLLWFQWSSTIVSTLIFRGFLSSTIIVTQAIIASIIVITYIPRDFFFLFKLNIPWRNTILLIFDTLCLFILLNPLNPLILSFRRACRICFICYSWAIRFPK